MPEREFFSLRNTVPGVTFILIILGINYDPLFRLLQGTNQGIQLFLGILTIVTGSAIGFLITQFWWGSFEAGKKVRAIVLKKTLDCVITKFTIANLKNNYAEAIRVFDFITGNEDNQLSAYSSRRWDVFHLLSATVVAIVLGSVLGGSIRYLLQFSPFAFPINATVELPIITFIIGSLILLLLFMFVNMKKCREDYIDAKRTLILNFNPDLIACNFPVSYFNLKRFRTNHPDMNLKTFEEKGVLTATMAANMSSNQLNTQTGIPLSDLAELKCELDELFTKNQETHRLLKFK